MQNKTIENIKKMNDQELKEHFDLCSRLFHIAIKNNHIDLADKYLEIINITGMELELRNLKIQEATEYELNQ